ADAREGAERVSAEEARQRAENARADVDEGERAGWGMMGVAEAGRVLEVEFARRQQQDVVTAAAQLLDDECGPDLVAADKQRRVQIGKDDDTHVAPPGAQGEGRPRGYNTAGAGGSRPAQFTFRAIRRLVRAAVVRQGAALSATMADKMKRRK